MLTNKQEAFCLAYLTEPDASKAYRKVYSAGKMKDATVWEAASRLLADSKVAARVDELRRAAATEAVINEAEILRELRRLALSDPGAIFGPDGKLVPMSELPAHVRACIAAVKVTERWEGTGEARKAYDVIEYKLWDKNSAIEKAMKHLGSFERDNKQRAGIFDNLNPAETREVQEFLRELSRTATARVAALADGD